MPAIFFPIILTFSTLYGLKVVSGELPGPRNVRITSFNMDLVLRWDPPENATNGLVYRAEYNSTVSDFRVGCLNTTAHSCNFTNLQIVISVFGTYAGRVRAELWGENSAWVESGPITMDENTTIGPPGVSLIPNGANMEVSIQDPVFRIPGTELRKTYTYVAYNITYWKKTQEEKSEIISNQQTRVVLNDMEPWTTYCVQVQINTDRNFKPSQPSEITCESTTTGEQVVAWVVAVVTFVVMAMIVTLVVLVVVYHRKMSHFLCPKDSLPLHIKEYLLEPPHSSIYAAMQNSFPPEEIYHQVSIISGERTEEEEELPLQAGGSNCNTQADNVTEE